MTVDYKISATLTVKDELSAVLQKVAAIGRQANVEMSKLLDSIGKLGNGFDKVSLSADQFSARQSKAFAAFSANAGKAQAAAASLDREVGTLASRSALRLPGGSAKAGSQGGGKMRSGGKEAEEAGTFDVSAGMAMIGVGDKIGGVLMDFAKVADENVQQMEMLKKAGITDNEVLQATQTANKVSHLDPGTTDTENLQTIGEFRAVMPGMQPGGNDSVNLVAQMAKLSATMASFNGGVAPPDLVGKMADAVKAMGGTVDPKTGKDDPARAASMIAAINAAEIQSRGRIAPDELVKFGQSAPDAVKGMDPDKAIAQNAPLILQMGGEHAAAGLEAFQKQLAAMSPAMMKVWEKLHLLDAGKVSKTKDGALLQPGAIKGEDVLKGAGGVQEWLSKVVVPTLQKDGMDNKQIPDGLARMFGNDSAQHMVSILLAQPPQGGKAGAKSDTGAAAAEPKTLAEASKAFDAQEHQIISAIGASAQPLMLGAMKMLTGLFTAIADFATAHPTIVKTLVIIAAAIAAFLVVLGAIAVVVVGVSAAIAFIGGAIAAVGGSGVALLIAGIAAAIVAVGVAVAAFDWTKIFNEVVDWLNSIFKAVRDWIHNMVDKVLSYLPNRWLGGDKSPAPASADDSLPAGHVTPANDGGSAVAGPQVYRSKGKSDSMFDPQFAAAIGDIIAGKLNNAKVTMDGESVGKLTVDRMGREAERPSTGVSFFDQSQSPSYPSFNLGGGH